MSKTTHTDVSLPPQVLQLLKISKFLHLATSYNDVPNVSLMNYTFVDQDDAAGIVEPFIIVSASKNSQTHLNISKNPNVAILLHDWTIAKNVGSPGNLSTLTQVLLQLNQTELSSHSATLNGTATIVSAADQVAALKERHLRNNPEAECFIKADDISIIKVVISKAKVSDSTNHVEEYSDLQPRSSN